MPLHMVCSSEVSRISRMLKLDFREVFSHVRSKCTNFFICVVRGGNFQFKHPPRVQLRRAGRAPSIVGSVLTEDAVQGADIHVTWRPRADVHRLMEKRENYYLIVSRACVSPSCGVCHKTHKTNQHKNT